MYASVQDVDTRWDEASFLHDPAEVARVQMILDEAHDELTRIMPDLATRMATGAPTAITVRRVVIGAVLRVLDNPKGVTSEHAGDTGWNFATGAARRGEVEFTTDDVARLRGSTGGSVASVTIGLPAHRMPSTIRRGHW